MNWLYHLVFYGAIGLLVEVLFTSLHSVVIDRNPKAVGTTYLWMFVPYSACGYGFEWFRELLILASFPLILRVLAYLTIIYAVEYATGWLLEKTIGVCPWHYANSKWTIHNKIRLDYAPFWMLLCFSIEPIQHLLEKMFCG